MNEEKDFLLNVFSEFLKRSDLLGITVKNSYGEITAERAEPQENETSTYAVGFTMEDGAEYEEE